MYNPTLQSHIIYVMDFSSHKLVAEYGTWTEWQSRNIKLFSSNDGKIIVSLKKNNQQEMEYSFCSGKSDGSEPMPNAVAERVACELKTSEPSNIFELVCSSIELELDSCSFDSGIIMTTSNIFGVSFEVNAPTKVYAVKIQSGRNDLEQNNAPVSGGDRTIM